MESKIFCIFSIDLDNISVLKGYINGTSEDAKNYCEAYNKKCEYYWEKLEWEELKNLCDDK